MADNIYQYYNNDFEDEDEQEGFTEKLASITEDEKKLNTFVRSTEIDGMFQIHLSKLTQEIVGCKVDEDVTTEYPWIFVKKEIIEDNLDLHFENSDFFPIRDDIYEYTGKEILIGLATTTTTNNKPKDSEFYICLTENSRNTVIKQIDLLRNIQENRVKNSVFRPINQWCELGSNKDIDHLSIKRQRALLEIKIIIKRRDKEFSKVPNLQLVDFNSEQSRDSYIELVNTRQSFNNHISRKIVSLAESTYPIICDNNTQTLSSKCINSWFQYFYDSKLINTEAYNEEEAREIEKFLRIHTNNLCHQIVMNEVWDIYADDCEKLVKNNNDIKVPIPPQYVEHQSYHNIKITKNKIINDLNWHPLLSGIVIVTYTDNSKSHISTVKNNENQVLKACHENNYVLIWSLIDCLSPKLILECPREVAAVSFNPLNGNYVVGGCTNGQIAIWYLTEEIKKIQELISTTGTTTAQFKYKIIMKNLMNWMKEPSGVTINPISMSSIKESQKNYITKIIWLSKYVKICKNGKFIQSKSAENFVGGEWQFLTSSEDGTVAFWDLRIQENDSDNDETQINKFLKQFNDSLTPIYMLKVKHPGTERCTVITTMCFYVPTHGDSFQNEEIPKKIFIGTLEGDVGIITWDGFEFATDLTGNNGEVTTWIWCNNSIHNGPVSHSVRSKYLDDIILTVGGNVFAIWRLDFAIPIFMKKSSFRYSACSWGTSRPTVIILARADGTIEIWDLIVKTHEACFSQNLSGKIITGIYTDELYLNPQCVAFCDYNGAMRIFTAPSNLLIFEESDVKWMRSFVDREIYRVKEFEKWRNYYIFKKKNYQNNKEESTTSPKKQENIEIKNLNYKEMETKRSKIESEKITQPLKSGNAKKFIEEVKNNFKLMELKRMQRVILEKKGLRADDLDKRQAPVLKLRKEAKLKEKKINEIINKKDQIFEETVNFIFPEQNNDDTYQQTDFLSIKNDATIKKKLEYFDDIDTDVNEKTIVSEDQAIMNEFKNISKEMLEQMEKNSFSEPTFDWQEMMKEGQHRRYLLDIDLRNTLKKRTKVPRKLT